MTSGIGFSEVLLVLAIVVIFFDAKQVPGLIRKSLRIVSQARASIKKIMDDIDIK